MRVSRSKKHKNIKKRRKQIIMGMAGVLSAVTVASGTQLPAPTFGLYSSTSSASIHPDNELKAMSVFPATIQALVDKSKMAIAEADTTTVSLGTSEDANIVTTAQYQSNLADIVPPVSDGEAASESENEASEVSAEELSIVADIAQLQSLIDVKLQQESQIRGIWINAVYNEQIIWGVYTELQGYDRQFTDAEIRAKLLLDSALQQVSQHVSDIQLLISNLISSLESIQNEIADLENRLSQLQLSLEAIRLEKQNKVEKPPDESTDGEGTPEEDGLGEGDVTEGNPDDSSDQTGDEANDGSDLSIDHPVDIGDTPESKDTMPGDTIEEGSPEGTGDHSKDGATGNGDSTSENPAVVEDSPIDQPTDLGDPSGDDATNEGSSPSEEQPADTSDHSEGGDTPEGNPPLEDPSETNPNNEDGNSGDAPDKNDENESEEDPNNDEGDTPEPITDPGDEVGRVETGKANVKIVYGVHSRS